MSEDIGRAFDLQRSNPFELRNVHIIHSLEELDELGNDPKVHKNPVLYCCIVDNRNREKRETNRHLSPRFPSSGGPSKSI